MYNYFLHLDSGGVFKSSGIFSHFWVHIMVWMSWPLACILINDWLTSMPCCMLTGVQGNMIVWWVVFTELHSQSDKSQLEMQNLPNTFDKFMLQCVNYKQDLFAIWKPSVYCSALLVKLVPNIHSVSNMSPLQG